MAPWCVVELQPRPAAQSDWKRHRLGFLARFACRLSRDGSTQPTFGIPLGIPLKEKRRRERKNGLAA